MAQPLMDSLLAGWTQDTVARAVRRFTISPGADPNDEVLARELLRWLSYAASEDPELLASHMEGLRPGRRVPVKLSSADLLRGTVKWFNDTRGYGFIGREEDGADVFVHYSVIENDGFRTLNVGQRVMYQAKRGPKGLYAVKVTVTLVDD